MEMIGEESIVRDRPIYLQFLDLCDVYNSFWYVIEEKDDDGIEEKEEEEIHHTTDHRKNKNTNKIRDLKVPRILYCLDSLIVFDSRLYIIGGDEYPDDGIPEGWEPSYDIREDWEGACRSVFYFDLNNPEEGWLKGPTLDVHRQDQAVAALENSGIFVAFGTGRHGLNMPLVEFLDDSINGTWWKALPIVGPEFGPDCIEVSSVKLLAVTDAKVYIHCEWGMGFSYDIQNSEWEIFDMNFQGMWSSGVVLDFNSNSYLFLFGRKSTDDEECTEKLCVYDLINRTWLPSVEGLPKDGSVLPSDEYVLTSNELISQKYLLRMNQENKLALVWSTKYCLHHSFDIETKVCCTKFNIRCDFNSDSQLPIFRADVVSFGSFDVRNDTQLINCAVSPIGEDKKKFGLSEEWMEI